MKVLLCGGSGLVGRTIFKIFKSNDIDIIGTFNSKYYDNMIKLDFLNIEELENSITNIKPDIIISNIAERQNEICENNWNKIKKINIDIPYNISLICKKHNIFMIHISTDYVYDGIIPPFTPNSNPNPLQNYGISKLIAEKRIISNFNDKTKYLILRVPVLYSDNMINLEESAVSLIVKKVMNKIECFKEDNYSIRRPVYIEDIANFLLFNLKNKTYTGIHCFYNKYDIYTKFKIAQLAGEILDKDTSHIIPSDNCLYQTALRPRDTQLYDEEIEKYLMNNNTTLLNDGLNTLLNKFKHPNLNINNDYTNDLFLLIDLDGTIIDSEKVQWKSYRDALKDYNIEYDFETFTKICHNGDIKKYLIENYKFTKVKFNEMKEMKKKYMLNYIDELKLIDGADVFINNILKNKINYCIVTNSSNETINIYKKKIPLIDKLQNFISRNDYNDAKPSSECFKLAIKKYYNNEKYIIGFENSICGLKALEDVTNIIYFITYKEYIFYEQVKKKDTFLIKHFKDI